MTFFFTGILSASILLIFSGKVFLIVADRLVPLSPFLDHLLSLQIDFSFCANSHFAVFRSFRNIPTLILTFESCWERYLNMWISFAQILWIGRPRNPPFVHNLEISQLRACVLFYCRNRLCGQRRRLYTEADHAKMLFVRQKEVPVLHALQNPRICNFIFDDFRKDLNRNYEFFVPELARNLEVEIKLQFNFGKRHEL